MPVITKVLNLYDETLEALTKKHFPWNALKGEAVFIQLWKVASGTAFRLGHAGERQAMVMSVVSDFCH